MCEENRHGTGLQPVTGVSTFPVEQAILSPACRHYFPSRTGPDPLHLTDDSLHLVSTSNPMVVGLILPKGNSGASRELIAPPRRGPFQPAHDLGERVLRSHDDMHKIRHHDP